MKKFTCIILLVFGGCVSSKGSIKMEKDAKGNPIISWESSTPLETSFETPDKYKFKLKTLKEPKPSMLDKAADLATVGITRRVIDKEDD